MTLDILNSSTVKGKKKILIVEDERPMAKALQLKLTHVGYEAMNVGNGLDAIALLDKNTFDVILLDLMMPKMDGFTFLREMQKRAILTPIIVLSNLSQEEDRQKAKELGAKDFFVKSDTPISKIVTSVQAILQN
jgi:DNA-binding response OmpR family regulator